MRGNNDVYMKVACADNAVYTTSTVNGITTGKWGAPPSSSDGNPALAVFLVLLVLVAVAGATFAAHKNRAALAARAKQIQLWMKGEVDARPYTRNHEVAGMASATTLPTPSSTIGGGADHLTVTVPPSTYNPPATF